jgi:hypothetical protein
MTFVNRNQEDTGRLPRDFNGMRTGTPSPVYEEEWKMTSAFPDQILAAVGLGALNVVGVLWLGNLLVRSCTAKAKSLSW